MVAHRPGKRHAVRGKIRLDAGYDFILSGIHDVDVVPVTAGHPELAAVVALFRFFCLANAAKLRGTKIAEFTEKLLVARPISVRFFCQIRTRARPHLGRRPPKSRIPVFL